MAVKRYFMCGLSVIVIYLIKELVKYYLFLVNIIGSLGLMAKLTTEGLIVTNGLLW